MKAIRCIVGAVLFGGSLTSVAVAHPGHAHTDIPSLIRHPFAGPEHLLGSAACGLAVAGLLYFATRRFAMPAFVRWTGLVLIAAGVTLSGPV